MVQHRQGTLRNLFTFRGFPAQAGTHRRVLIPPNMLLRLLALPQYLTSTVVLHVWISGSWERSAHVG